MKTKKKRYRGKVLLIFRKTIGRIPAVIWGAFAVFGVLLFGLIFGYAMGSEPETNPSPFTKLSLQNEKLKDLAKAYEEMGRLYSLQGDNVRVIFDTDILYNHPEEVADAFKSMEQYRGMINVQYGRILELRHAAGLPEDKQIQTN